MSKIDLAVPDRPLEEATRTTRANAGAAQAARVQRAAVGLAPAQTSGRAMDMATPRPRNVAKPSLRSIYAPPSPRAALTLDAGGTVLDCDAEAESLFSYRWSELVGRHVSAILPELMNADGAANGALAPRLHFLCCTGHVFEALTRDGRRFATELQVGSVGDSWPAQLRLSVGPVISNAVS